MPTPRHARPSRNKGTKPKPENVVRDWLMVRLWLDGVKMRVIAPEFEVSVQFVQQRIVRYRALVAWWRQQYSMCPTCGRGAPE